jgi:cytoskeletal protein CcmA (bactofilin family)
MGQNGAVPEQGTEHLMLVLAASVVFLILLLMPFIPGIIELRRPRDADPLYIDMEYTKDPRYFGKSFKSVIKKYVQSDPLHPGLKNISLSQKEEILISPSRIVLAGENVNHILCISGDLISEEKAHFQKESYATGNIIIGQMNVVKALASDGRIKLDRHTTVLRWVDAEHAVAVSEGSNLGISLSCGGEIRIAQGCRFQRLYGFPIVTSFTNSECIDKNHGLDHKIMEMQNADRNISIIPRGSRIEKDLIVKHNLRIEENCVITGNIKTYRGLVIGKHATVSGSIFSEEDIMIAEHAVIDGNIFSQGTVIIQGDTRVGEKGQIKSVIGKSGVDLGPNVCVYGYVLTEGVGMT